MKRKPYQFSEQAKRRYEKELESLTRLIEKAVTKQKTAEAITSALLELASSDKFKRWAYSKASGMVRSVLVNNAKNWREAARKGTESQRIFAILSQEFSNRPEFNKIILENAQLIQSLPLKLASSVSMKASKLAIEGKRASEIYSEIKQYAPHMADYRIKTIARTEVAKANAAIVQTRALAAGVNWYSWETVNDSRVRSSHEHMQGVLCQFNSPPSPEVLDGQDPKAGFYNPGGIYNCRCFASPVILLDAIEWPAKVHYNGRIVRMTRRQFEAL